MSGNSVGASLLPELFRFGLYKARQGRLVRQVTVVCLAVLAGFGCVSLAGQLTGVAAANPEYGQYIRIGVPFAVWLLSCWIAFRAVNVPRFADFLISVEAELERVVWPGQQQVIQATIVVLVVMFSLGAFLTVMDLLWKALFSAIGFTEY